MRMDKKCDRGFEAFVLANEQDAFLKRFGLSHEDGSEVIPVPWRLLAYSVVLTECAMAK